MSTIFVFALSYAVNTIKIDQTSMLTVGVIANVVALAAIPSWAALSDRIGRKPVLILGVLVPGALMCRYLWSISQANIPLIFLFGVLMSGVFYSASNGIWPSFYGEMVDTRVRLSGTAIPTQIRFALAGFAPAIKVARQGADIRNWVPVAVLTAAASIVSAVAASTARETYNVHMHDLGTKSAPGRSLSTASPSAS